jgi:hypothetical protein
VAGSNSAKNVIQLKWRSHAFDATHSFSLSVLNKLLLCLFFLSFLPFPSYFSLCLKPKSMSCLSVSSFLSYF